MTNLIRSLVAIVGLALFSFPILCRDDKHPASDLRVARFVDGDRVEVKVGEKKVEVRKGGNAGQWTLLEIIEQQGPGGGGLAVFEDFSQRDGVIRFVGTDGLQLELPKTSEPTAFDTPGTYCGHTMEQILESSRDLLGEEMLSTSADPDRVRVSKCFPPLTKMKTITFVGTHENIDKVGLEYGGMSPNFDPAVYDGEIRKVRDDGKVWNGLVGGWLPVVRYVYPTDEKNWTEMIAFAPMRISNGNQRIQPVWYRVAKVDNGSLKWVRYFDTYHPFPPRIESDSKTFYSDLIELQRGWTDAIQPSIHIEVPDQQVQNMAVHSVVRAMMTRVGDFPKYGAFDKNYAGSEHDGFPDTFTVDTAAMLSWGMVDLAGRYIDNYLEQFVRDDGSILYRGPETGQFGRMLTLFAQYANYGGDPKLLLQRRSRIDGITNLLLSMRLKAQRLPKDNPAYGMIVGWSEADACLEPDPSRYMQPYFSNSAEAARGFRDLGHVWETIGRDTKDTKLEAWGQRLVRESEKLQQDLHVAIQRSILKDNGENIIPSIAGVNEPFHVVLTRDILDPQYRAYRAYMEMLYSGMLDKEEVTDVVQYRATHHDVILGIPIAYGYRTSEWAGFLSYGHAYGLIQHDMIREALLELYSLMANQYTRGTWTAPETRNVQIDKIAAPYCVPAELVVPLITRWLLVFEDPQSETLWLGKGVPREWLEDGKTVFVSGAPTRWGKVEFKEVSHLKSNAIDVNLNLPAMPRSATTIVRLRAPDGRHIESVLLGGQKWTQFDAKTETITLPAGVTANVHLEVRYLPSR